MKNLMLSTMIGVLAAVICQGRACAQDKAGELVKFSASIAANKQALFKSGQSFGTKVLLTLDDASPENVLAMKGAYVDALIVMATMDEDWQKTAPVGGKEGTELHAAFRAFLQSQRASINTIGLDVVRMAQNRDLAPEVRKKRFLEIVQAGQKGENAASAALEKAHKAFRDAHDIK